MIKKLLMAYYWYELKRLLGEFYACKWWLKVEPNDEIAAFERDVLRMRVDETKEKIRKLTRAQ